MNRSEIGPLLAQGRTATVHAWGAGWVLKLFRPEFERAAVEEEAHVARLVHAAGAPAPAVGEVLSVAGRYGLVYAQVEGVPMSEVLMRRPWRAAALGKRLARLHVQVHARQILPALPSQHGKLMSKIQNAVVLSAQVRQAALNALATIPQGTLLCHGDFHPANVLIGPTSDTVIDWTDASCGHPLADVARTLNILMGEAQPASGRSAATRRVLRRFYSAYLAEYRARADVDEPALDLWRSISAAARLAEGLDSLTPWLVAQTRRLAETVAAR